MQRRFRAYLLAGALAALAPALPAQEVVDVPIAQARVIMVQAAQQGNPALAAEIARAILAQNPDDRDALVVLAITAPQLGDPAAGRKAGARAWRLSETPAQRYEAARATALAANAGEQFTLATLWLRIALIHAPTPEERARTLRDAASVVRRNPWTTQLSFSLVPSNNVNGGAESDVSTAPGNPTGTLSEDAQALAGWRGTFGLNTTYRLQESPTSRTTAGLQANISRVWITEDTTVPNEAFDNNSTILSLTHDRTIGAGRLSLGIARGVVDYRDLDLSAETTSAESYDLSRLNLSYRRPISDREALTLGYGRELLTYENPSIGEINRNTLSIGLNFALPSGNQSSVSYSFTDSVSDSTNYTSTENSVSFAYGWAEPLVLNNPDFLTADGLLAAWGVLFYAVGEATGPITRSANIGLRWSDYPEYSLLLPVTGGRQDRTIFAGVNLGFPAASFAGFTPGLRLDLSRSNSNVSRFDRETASVGFTISSQF